MARYVDSFVLPIRRRRIDEYRRMARKAGKVWIEHGALEFIECVEDDVDPGTPTSFPRSVNGRIKELVGVAYIVFKSRAHRDRVTARVKKDPRFEEMTKQIKKQKKPPFDPNRMFRGGFKTLVHISADH